MHRVGSTGNAANAGRHRKEKRVTYVVRNSEGNLHCSGVNALLTVPGPAGDTLFSAGRDGTVKRWEQLEADAPSCVATYESHVDWVNSLALVGKEALVSCSSDSSVKVWRAFSSGECMRTLRQHSDYVTCLAAAKQVPLVASGGLGCELFVWDIEAATSPVSQAAPDAAGSLESETPPVRQNGGAGPSGRLSGGPSFQVGAHSSFGVTGARDASGTGASSLDDTYQPVLCKGHKDSIYALAMNEAGTVLVSGSTEKAIRVWDPRTGTKQMKLKGHTENVRSLLIDPSGRFCLSGSSDATIRLWDLGQQRCVHSYAVHTDSVWALAASANFQKVFSGGRDAAVYCTDLGSRESVLLCCEEAPVLSLCLGSGQSLWVATPRSALQRWSIAERGLGAHHRQASSFVAHSLPSFRARASQDGSTKLQPLHKSPVGAVEGSAGIIKHSVLNDRRHVLTKDTDNVVKLWEVTSGQVVADYGEVEFEEKEKELFEMVSVPAWFSVDTRLGAMAIHLEPPSCFNAEIYAMDIGVPNASEELKLNLGEHTLRGLFAHWLERRCALEASSRASQRSGSTAPTSVPGGAERGVAQEEASSAGDDGAQPMAVDAAQGEGEGEQPVEAGPPPLLPLFTFSASHPPSIISEGAVGGPWRKSAAELDGTEDEREIPMWVLDSVLHGRLPPRDQAKCSFYLIPYEGSGLQQLTQGKLSAPRILRIHKVMNYVTERLGLEVPGSRRESEAEERSGEDRTSDYTSVPVQTTAAASGQQERPQEPLTEILCNDQVLRADMSLATVRAYVWKKSEDLQLHYRLVQARH